MGSSCSPSSVNALPGAGGLLSAQAPAPALTAAAAFPPALPGPLGAATATVGVVAASSPANSASQSCASGAAEGLALAPAPCCSAAVAGTGPAVLPAADVPDSEPKSKLLSVPNTGPAVCAESLLGWLGGGLLSKTGLKSSRPEREMVAKSSSAEPSLASSRPSKSSSRSSKALAALAPLETVAAVVGRLVVVVGLVMVG